MGQCLVNRPRVVAAVDAGDAEVEDAHVQANAALVEQEDVVRLDVAVDDALAVGVDQGQQHLAAELQARLERQCPLRRQAFAQRLALQILHDQVRAVDRVDAEVVDDDDVRVGELAGELGLALEARVELGLAAQLGVDELDGHFAVER